MVKVTGPAFSQRASGSLGTSVNFSQNKGVAVARMKPKPRDPKTPPQISFRAVTKFLSKEWAGLSSAEKATWEGPPRPPYNSPRNAFTGLNISAWRTFTPPSRTYLPPGPPPPIAFPLVFADPGVKKLDFRILAFSWANIWGFALFRGDFAGFTPSVDNAVALFPCTALWTYYTDAPLTSGQTYYYRVFPFDAIGTWGPSSTIVAGTPL